VWVLLFLLVLGILVNMFEEFQMILSAKTRNLYHAESRRFFKRLFDGSNR